LQLTPEQLEAVSARQATIMDGAMKLVAALPDDSNLVWEASVMSVVDGLVGAIAMIAEASQMHPSQRQKRLFADNVRTALLKSMKVARAEVTASMAAMHGQDN